MDEHCLFSGIVPDIATLSIGENRLKINASGIRQVFI
jgi:hypothetical protein